MQNVAHASKFYIHWNLWKQFGKNFTVCIFAEKVLTNRISTYIIELMWEFLSHFVKYLFFRAFFPFQNVFWCIF